MRWCSIAGSPCACDASALMTFAALASATATGAAAVLGSLFGTSAACMSRLLSVRSSVPILRWQALRNCVPTLGQRTGVSAAHVSITSTATEETDDARHSFARPVLRWSQITFHRWLTLSARRICDHNTCVAGKCHCDRHCGSLWLRIQRAGGLRGSLLLVRACVLGLRLQ